MEEASVDYQYVERKTKNVVATGLSAVAPSLPSLVKQQRNNTVDTESVRSVS